MDNQNSNNMFGNMIQPSAIPEVKDNSNMMTSGNNLANNSLNQNGNLMFEMPQNSSAVQSNNVSMSTNNSFINNEVASTPVNLGNNIVQDNHNLSFDNVLNSEPVNYLNMGNQISNGAATNSNLNSMDQSFVQSADNMDSLQGSVDNTGTSSSTNVPLDMGMNVGLNVQSPLTEAVCPNVNTANVDSNVSNDNDKKARDVVSVKEYLVHMILTCIPVVGFIILIIRAIDRKNESISNLARAQLLISAAFVLLGVLFSVIMGASLVSALS